LQFQPDGQRHHRLLRLIGLTAMEATTPCGEADTPQKDQQGEIGMPRYRDGRTKYRPVPGADPTTVPRRRMA